MPRVLRFGVVDLFAGPGGLAEGFAAAKDSTGAHPFEIALSIEKDSAAHKTLLLRTFLRQFDGGFPEEYYTHLNDKIAEPDWESLYPKQWNDAVKKALLLEMGAKGTSAALTAALNRVKRKFGSNLIVIGGPPCQAYSLVGRARNHGKASYVPERDRRHTLYRQYIKILDVLKPKAFVMENVKGLLSSSLRGRGVFGQICEICRMRGVAMSYCHSCRRTMTA